MNPVRESVARASLLAAVVAASLCCHRNPPIVGTWTSESELMGKKLSNEITINEDGTFREVTTPAVANPAFRLKAIDTGTWKLEGDKLISVLRSEERRVG